MFLGTVLHLVRENLPPGVITYRTDGKLFNHNRLRAKTKIFTTTTVELQYADDNDVLTNTEEDLQTTLNAFRQAYESIGLEQDKNPVSICSKYQCTRSSNNYK